MYDRMSSILRRTVEKYKSSTKVMPVHSACYSDTSTGQDLLFPFIIKQSGELDLRYTNSFESDMIDTTGQAPDDGGDDPSKHVIILGNERLVRSLGDNFKAYIRAWRTSTIDPGSDITLWSPGCIMINVRSTHVNHSSSFQVDTTPPDRQYFNNSATLNNNMLSTWIFKSPLVIKIVESGVDKYITFATTFEDD
jgi:hypothetical protein